MAVAPDGTLYFSDAVKKVLYRVSRPESGSPTYTLLTYSPSQLPNALSVDPSGNLWVADAGLKKIIEFSPTATTATQSTSVSPLVPTGIAVSASSVYFTDAYTEAVYGEGIATPLVSSFAGTKFNFAADQSALRPTGLGLDGAGNVYVFDASNKRLVEFNPAQTTTAFVVPFTGLTSPASMGVGPTGNLYITDDSQKNLTELVYGGNAINFGTVAAGSNSSTVLLNYAFNAAASTTGFYQRMQGDNTGEFGFDNNVCISSRIASGYICQQQFHVNYKAGMPGLRNGVVALTNNAGGVLGPIASFGISQAAGVAIYPGTVAAVSQSASNPTLLEPQGLAVSGGGNNLFVADEGGQLVGSAFTYSGKVYDYPQGGGPVTQVGGSTLVAPSALALNAAGDLYIADYSLGAIYVAPAANRGTVSKLAIPGGITLDHPIALAFDPKGNLFIGDTGIDAANANAANPGFIVKVPVGGGSATQFNYSIAGAPIIFPQALTTDGAGNLYIADGGDGQTSFGDLVLVPAATGVPALIGTGSLTLDEPSGLSFDAAMNLYVLDGYNSRVLVIPVTLAANGTPTPGTATVLPQSLVFSDGSSLVVWPGAQQISLSDIGGLGNPPVTQLLTIQTKTAAISFGPIQLGASQTLPITAFNVGNTLATFTPRFTETGDAAFTGPSTVCSGGIAVGGQCTINLTYTPDQQGTTTGQYVFNVNGSASNIVNATGTSTLAQPTVQLFNVTTSLVYPNGTSADVSVSGNFGTATGQVEILDGTTVLTTATLQSGAYYYYINYGTLSAGTHTLTAYYAGNSEYASATSAPVIVTVAPEPTTLNVTCYSNNNYYYGSNYYCSAYPNSIGNVVFTSDGTATTVPIVNGVASFTVTEPAVGMHTVVVSYAAQGNFATATPVTKSYTIAKAQTQLQLTPSSYSPTAGQSFTLTATMMSYSGAGAPNAGTVTFTDNGTTIGQATVANGAAVFTVTSPVAGYHTYVANYSGTSNFAAVSGMANVNVSK